MVLWKKRGGIDWHIYKDCPRLSQSTQMQSADVPIRAQRQITRCHLCVTRMAEAAA